MPLHPGLVQKDKVHSYSLSSTENKRETGSTVSNSSGLDLPFLGLFFFFFSFLKYSPDSLPSASLLFSGGQVSSSTARYSNSKTAVSGHCWCYIQLPEKSWGYLSWPKRRILRKGLQWDILKANTNIHVKTELHSPRLYFPRKISTKKSVFRKGSSHRLTINSVLPPLDQKLVPWISTRYGYCSQTLECSSKKEQIKRLCIMQEKWVRTCSIKTERQARAYTR